MGRGGGRKILIPAAEQNFAQSKYRSCDASIFMIFISSGIEFGMGYVTVVKIASTEMKR